MRSPSHTLSSMARSPSTEELGPPDRHQVSKVLPAALAQKERIVTFVIAFGPTLALVPAFAWAAQDGFHLRDLVLGLGMYLFTGLGIAAGFHRLFAHRSFTCPRPVQALLAIAGSMAFQGPLIRWVADHRRHHALTDHEGDPHSPHTGGGSPLRRFAHAHFGWFFDGEKTRVRRFATDLLRDRMLTTIDRCYVVWSLLSLALPAALGGLLGGSARGAISALLWAGFARIAFVQHMTWAVNSVGHVHGSQPFSTGDQSRNNALLAAVTLGEGWHNNHHAFPSVARFGFHPGEIDVAGGFIALLGTLGLASAIKRLPQERLARAAAKARSGEGRRRLVAAEIVVPRELDPPARARLAGELYAVHRRIFAGVDEASFARYVVDSSAAHTWIQLYRGEAGELCGYLAYHVFEITFDGETIGIVRCETGILREYRGGHAIGAFMIDRSLRYRLRHPLRPLYFVGVLVHPSTYTNFVTYTPGVWPRPGEPTPAPILGLMQQLAEIFGLEQVDQSDPLVRKVGWRTIDSEEDRAYWSTSNKPGVQFYLQRNPGYAEGHGLLTLLRGSLGVLLGFAVRYAIVKARSRGRVRVSKSSAERRGNEGGAAGHDGMRPPRSRPRSAPRRGSSPRPGSPTTAVFEPQAQVCRAARVGRARS